MFTYPVYNVGDPIGSAIKDSLVSWWSFDEASGNPRLDSHGSNDLAEFSSAVGQATGKQGSASDHTGSAGDPDILVDISPTGLTGTDTDFTVGVWTWFDTVAQMGYFGSGQDANANAVAHNWFLFYNGNFRMVGCDNGNYYQAVETTIGAISSGTWYFVLGQYDATADVLGIMVNDNTMNTLSSVPAINTGIHPMTVGGRISQAAVTSFDGRCDEGFYISRLLTDEEKSWLYNGGAGREYAEL